MNSRDVALVGLGSAIMVVSGWISIPVGPVPITMQTAGLFIISYILGAKRSVLAVSIYIVLGLLGLPVFSGFSGGVSKILSPSFGFILSYLPSAWIVGTSRGDKRIFMLGMIAASILMYIVGIPYMIAIFKYYLNQDISISRGISMGLLPFIPGDIVKIILSYLVAKRIRLTVVDKTT